MSHTSRTPARPLALLKGRPDFVRLYLAGTVSVFGSRFSQVALATAALRLSGGEATSVALVLAATFGPPALLGWFAGPVADRVHRGRLMILCDFVRAGLILLAVLASTPMELYAISLGLGVFTTFFTPAYAATIPDTVRQGEVLTANALRASTRSLLDIGGPALAALAISTVGIDAAFVIDGISYIVSAAFLAMLLPRGFWPVSIATAPQAVPRRIRRFFDDIREGVAYHGRQAVVRDLLLLLAISGLSVGALNTLLAVIVERHFGLPAENMGIISGVMAAGMTVGNLVVAHIGAHISRTALIASGYLASGGAALVVLLIPSFTVALIPFFVAGFANAGFHPPAEAWVQESVETELRGRVLALREIALNVAFVGSTLTAGLLADSAGLPVTWAGAALLMVVSGLLTTVLPALRAGAGKMEHEAGA